MIKIEKIKANNFDVAVRGMRNPMNSWHLSDSSYVTWGNTENLVTEFYLGPKDLSLMNKLYLAGPEHAKYLRQITVSMDITAPLYWWKEFDTYKVGTTANSTSTMHKIHAKQFTVDDFSYDHLWEYGLGALQELINVLEENRKMYLTYSKSQDKQERELARGYWYQMIQLLPSSYNQKRTVSMSYANVMKMINERQNHKLDEWRELVTVFRGLPYIKAIRGEE